MNRLRIGRFPRTTMTHVVMIRPGATVYDEQDRVQGILDLPLSERGKAEVARLAERLSSVSLSALYCGPGESVLRTADAVARAIGLRPKRLDDLRNLDQGLWQGLQLDEIRRRNLKLFRQWQDDPRTICPPRGETVEDAMCRIRAALRPLIRRHRDETIGLVVGEPIAQLIACYLRREPRVQLDDDVPTGGDLGSGSRSRSSWPPIGWDSRSWTNAKRSRFTTTTSSATKCFASDGKSVFTPSSATVASHTNSPKFSLRELSATTSITTRT